MAQRYGALIRQRADWDCWPRKSGQVVFPHLIANFVATLLTVALQFLTVRRGGSVLARFWPRLPRLAAAPATTCFAPRRDSRGAVLGRPAIRPLALLPSCVHCRHFARSTGRLRRRLPDLPPRQRQAFGHPANRGSCPTGRWSGGHHSSTPRPCRFPSSSRSRRYWRCRPLATATRQFNTGQLALASRPCLNCRRPSSGGTLYEVEDAHRAAAPAARLFPPRACRRAAQQIVANTGSPDKERHGSASLHLYRKEVQIGERHFRQPLRKCPSLPVQ